MEEGTRISYFPTVETAYGCIYECISDLMKMRVDIILCGNRPTRGLDLDKDQLEIFSTKSNVVKRLEKLFQETDTTIRLAPPPDTWDFPTIQTTLSTISEVVEQLLLMQQLIHIIVLSRPQSELLDEERQNVVHMKSRIVSRLDKLFKTTSKVPDSPPPVIHHDYDALVPDEPDDDKDLPQGKEFIGQQKLVGFKRSRVHEMKDTKGRYLCLSNGYEIWCLDLKLSSGNTGPGPLPLISTLNLLGGDVATSVGLFNFGSETYIIGGKKLPASITKQDYRNPTCAGNWGFQPEGIDHYKGLCYTRGAKGTSRVALRLSLDANMDDGSTKLSLPEGGGGFKKLDSPKFWPIVENIGGKLHVMDSCPFFDSCDFMCRAFVFSHEVCEGRGSGWKTIQTKGREDRVFNHLVVGSRIYAITCERSDGDYFLEFDSETEEWFRFRRTGERVVHGLQAKTVWDVLSAGVGRCVGEFQYPFPREEGEPQAFVLFAISQRYHDSFTDPVATLAVAYLVTLTGQVVCYQPVPDFYYFEDELLQPFDMMAATVIHVDEDQEGRMCSVVSAAMRKDDREKEYLFVNTFSVEMLASSAPKVRDLLYKVGEVEAGPAVELEFVRVAVKDRFIYETDLDTRTCGIRRALSWRACFMTPSAPPIPGAINFSSPVFNRMKKPYRLGQPSHSSTCQ